MKKVLILMFLFPNLSYGQIDTANMEMQDSVNVKISFKPFIIPAVLISYGVATKISEPLRKWDYNIADKTAKYSIKADDYIQYASHVAVFGLNFIGIKSKHNLRDRTFIVAASSIITALIVQTSKRT
ncbi:MAG: hypothetical protein LBP85_06555, partial [Prevotellaceae bacterium]|nr:hypothetical protein [Prevotellaceae bacterium]